MNVFSSKDARAKLKNRWPHLDDPQIVPRGTIFKTYESIDQLIDIVKICSVKNKFEYVSGAFECEFFATLLMAAVWKYQYEREIRPLKTIPEEAIPYFYGLCLGMRFKTHHGNHNVNIAFVGKNIDIALIDATNDVVWMADDSDDYPYFILR